MFNSDFFGGYGVAQNANPGDFDFHHIAFFEVLRRVETGTGAIRRTGRNDVARLDRDTERLAFFILS